MWKNTWKIETLHMKARWEKQSIWRDRFLTNFCLSTTRLLINLHEKKVWNRLLFSGITEKCNSRTNCCRLKQKKKTNFKRQCRNSRVFLHAHTSMENGLNVNGLHQTNFQHLQRKTEWFSGGSLTTGKLKTMC